MHIEPTGAALGAVVSDVDLAALDPDQLHALRSAWRAHQVLIIRGQRLAAEDLVAFSRRFGALEPSPSSDTHAAGAQAGVPPEVWIISNIQEGGRPIGALGDGEAAWHTDMSYVDAPARASVLYAVEIPSKGGDTWFADMYAAYATLPPDLRAVVDAATVHHDASTTSVGDLRVGAAAALDVTRAPGARHPAARLHPESRRPALLADPAVDGWVLLRDFFSASSVFFSLRSRASAS